MSDEPSDAPSAQTGERMLWRRLDAPGHDAGRLTAVAGGWRLDGVAVYQEGGADACLRYAVRCDAQWRTRRGRVRGWVGDRQVAVTVRRSADGGWSLDGVPQPQLAGCIDLDLGFTPATNLIALRRLALEVGAAGEVASAWFDVATGTLDVLRQRYERRDDHLYWYEAPRFGYAALIELEPGRGFVRRYPGLWAAER